MGSSRAAAVLPMGPALGNFLKQQTLREMFGILGAGWGGLAFRWRSEPTPWES